MQPPPAEAPRGMLSRCQAAEKVPAPPAATCFVASAFHVHSVPSMKEPRQRRRCDHLAAERVTASQRRAQKRRDLALGHQYASVAGSGLRSSAHISTAPVVSVRAPRGVRSCPTAGWRNTSDARREALKLVRRPRSRTATRPGIGTDGRRVWATCERRCVPAAPSDGRKNGKGRRLPIVAVASATRRKYRVGFGESGANVTQR